MANFSPLEDDFKTLKFLIEILNIKTVLEFGPGESSNFFRDQGLNLCSYENNEKYVKFNNENNIPCELFKDEPGLGIDLCGRTYQMAFVDGPRGKKVLSRFNTLKFSIENCKYTVLHDSRRKGERHSLKELEKEFNIEVHHFITKKGICLIINKDK